MHRIFSAGSEEEVDPAVDAVPAAVEDFRAGRMVVLHDESLSVLAVPAESVDAAAVNRLIHAGGLISVALAAESADSLRLPEMPGVSRTTVRPLALVDSDRGTTGISAADRAATIRALAGGGGSLVAPGHVLPIRVAAEAELTARPGIPEACVTLAREAGVTPAVAICDLLDPAGEVVPPAALGHAAAARRLTTVSATAVHAHRRGLRALSVCDVPSFQEAMSRLVSGVAAVTVRGEEGAPKGMLATSVTSYSSSPPTLLVCVAHGSRTHDPLVGAAGFGVHLLAADQEEVARGLAGKRDDKFASIEWSWDGDVPRIADVGVYLRCAKGAAFVHHDHTIIVGELELAESSDPAPLVYFRRSFDWALAGQGSG